MSAIGFENIHAQPSLRARLGAWFEGARRAGQEAHKRPACSPTAPLFGRMVGARPAAGVCGAVAEDGVRRRNSPTDHGCPRQHLTSLLGGPKAAASCGIARELAAEQKRGRRIERAVSHYVSPHVLDRLMSDPDGVGLGGEVRDVSVLFADLRGFTGLAETLKDDPRRLGEVLAAVTEPLTEIVLAHGGVLDKYMGDCVMAFWGAPAEDPDHAKRALDAALAMQAATGSVSAGLRGAFGVGFPDVSIGVGLNSGPCLVGNVGSRHRFDYSVLGDPVNVASRLQELCKSYDVPLLIGEATVSRLGPHTGLSELDHVILRGRIEPQRIYALT